LLSPAQRDAYASKGYLAPLPALSPAAALSARAAIEGLIAQGMPMTMLRTKAHLHCPALLALVRAPAILDTVSDVIGPDLLCRSSSIFLKEPGEPAYVAWHQDSAYWALDPPDVVTAWVALTDSTAENGALQVLPGSHREPQLAHGPSHDPSNMLQHGQKILGPLRGGAVPLLLRPGEMSLHHVGIAHGSPPNRSKERRIGLAIRYVATHVRKLGPRRDSAMLVRGTDQYGNFDRDPEPPATG
jgi:non-heme Fe2+,alpha-ketoglutarate-dependent halogenase